MHAYQRNGLKVISQSSPLSTSYGAHSITNHKRHCEWPPPQPLRHDEAERGYQNTKCPTVSHTVSLCGQHPSARIPHVHGICIPKPLP